MTTRLRHRPCTLASMRKASSHEELRFDFSAAEPEPEPEPGPEPRLPEVVGAIEVVEIVEEVRVSGPGLSLAELRSAEYAPAGSVSDSALSVAGFYERLRLALRSEFPDEIWVTGEIRKVTVSKGHRYIELADHEVHEEAAPRSSARGQFGPRNRQDATLEVACWSREWPLIGAALESVGVELKAGLVVRVRGRVSVWEAGARVRFSMTDIDVEALVGNIAAARRRLLEALRAEGLIDANRRLPIPAVPLRIGLVTSAGSEAYRDFTGQLERSGYQFDVRLESSLVQGVDAPAGIAAALERLQHRAVDVIVLVRGGGAKSDLGAFDHEAVARAIVCSRIPVWTGIGHTGDRSVADEVASRSFVTPTACGEGIVDQVAAYLGLVAERALRLSTSVERAMLQAEGRLGSAHSDLSRAARHEIGRAEASLASRRSGLARCSALAVGRSAGLLARRSDALVAHVRHRITVASHDIASRRATLAGFDPRRQLARGWTLTRRGDGSIIRSAGDVAAGDELVTVMVDGAVMSTATAAVPASTEE